MFRDGRTGCRREMVELPGGTYTTAASGASVAVAPFLLDVTEVTVAAYTACVTAGKCSERGLASCGRSANYGKPERGDHPVNCVDWMQAQAYCAAIGKRLPSDDEWEWAARGAARGTPYPWGGAAASTQVCWDGEGNDRGKGNRSDTCAVGSFPGGDSPQGLKDLAGNVWEWTAAASGGERGNRGGSWMTSDPRQLSTARRAWDDRSFQHTSLGFRCAKTL
jgi:formylglycine-generating enzyme required for sulfatase activity